MTTESPSPVPADQAKNVLRAALLPRLTAAFQNTPAREGGAPADDRLVVAEEKAKDALAAWFEPLEICLEVRQGGNEVCVRFPHAFFGPWFEQCGKIPLEKAAVDLWGRDVRLVYQSPATREPAGGLPAGRESNEKVFAAVWGVRPDGSFGPLPGLESNQAAPNFDSFLVGAKNQFALAVLQQMGSTGAPTLAMLSGASGSGKTHLLRAKASALVHETPGGAVPCLSALDFAALFRAPRAGRDRFRLQLRSCAALCLDDIHLLGDAPEAQEELCDLIDVFQDVKRPVLCSSSSDSAEAGALERLSPALSSRLSMGVLLPLAEPDLDVRLRYAQAEFQRLGLAPGRDVPLLLARSCPNLRQLGGAIRRMAAFQSHTGQLPDEHDLDNIVRSSGSSHGITPDAILALVAARCGYTSKDLRGKKREPRLVEARQIAMYLCRELLGESYPSLGQIFGGKDHSTVMYAVKKIKKSRFENNDMHMLITELTQRCRKNISVRVSD